MKLPSRNAFGLILGIITSAALAPFARADIVGTPSYVSLDTDNLRFGDLSLLHSGSLVQGNFLGTGLGYVMNFTSTSGNGLLTGIDTSPTRVEGVAGNAPLATLSFTLSQSSQTFTKAVFNLNAATDGNLLLSVLEPNGDLTTFNFFASGTGANYFTIEAINGQTIRSISLAHSSIDDLREIRVGGFAGGVGSSVPDSGTTAAMLGIAIAGLAAVRRRLVS